MTKRKNWRREHEKAQRSLNAVTSDLVAARKELAELKRPKKWVVSIGAQEWVPANQDAGREDIRLLMDAGAWHATASNALGKPKLSITAQRWDYADYEKARDQVRRLLNARLWFFTLEVVGQ